MGRVWRQEFHIGGTLALTVEIHQLQMENATVAFFGLRIEFAQAHIPCRLRARVRHLDENLIDIALRLLFSLEMGSDYRHNTL